MLILQGDRLDQSGKRLSTTKYGICGTPMEHQNQGFSESLYAFLPLLLAFLLGRAAYYSEMQPIRTSRTQMEAASQPLKI